MSRQTQEWSYFRLPTQCAHFYRTNKGLEFNLSVLPLSPCHFSFTDRRFIFFQSEIAQGWVWKQLLPLLPQFSVSDSPGPEIQAVSNFLIIFLHSAFIGQSTSLLLPYMPAKRVNKWHMSNIFWLLFVQDAEQKHSAERWGYSLLCGWVCKRADGHVLLNPEKAVSHKTCILGKGHNVHSLDPYHAVS